MARYVLLTAMEETVSAVEETVSSGDAVIQVAEIIDYTETLAQLVVRLDIVNALLQYLTGFVLFFVIVILCYFGYKFFKLFF